MILSRSPVAVSSDYIYSNASSKWHKRSVAPLSYYSESQNDASVELNNHLALVGTFLQGRGLCYPLITFILSAKEEGTYLVGISPLGDAHVSHLAIFKVEPECYCAGSHGVGNG